MSREVTLLCTNISLADKYTVDLINLLTSRGVVVNIVSNTNFSQKPTNLYTQVNLPPNNLLKDAGNIKCWALKDLKQETLTSLNRARRSRVTIYVCKDAENSFEFTENLAGLSIFVLLLSYDNIPLKTKKVIGYFKFLVATGLNSRDKLLTVFPDKAPQVILPSYIPINSTFDKFDVRKQLGIDTRKFVFFLDVNEYLEIKSLDVIVRSFMTLVHTNSDFKKDCLLLINALPTEQLQNILKLEKIAHGELQVFVPYYSNGFQQDVDVIRKLIASSDVVMHMNSGGDFDTNTFLAQETGKLVLRNDVHHFGDYYPFSLKVKKTQPYFDGLMQAFLLLPHIPEVISVMKAAYDRRGTKSFVVGDAVRNKITTFKEKYGHFEDSWTKLLKGIAF